jgi:hypothetical protein
LREALAPDSDRPLPWLLKLLGSDQDRFRFASRLNIASHTALARKDQDAATCALVGAMHSIADRADRSQLKQQVSRETIFNVSVLFRFKIDFV